MAGFLITLSVACLTAGFGLGILYVLVVQGRLNKRK